MTELSIATGPIRPINVWIVLGRVNADQSAVVNERKILGSRLVLRIPAADVLKGHSLRNGLLIAIPDVHHKLIQHWIAGVDRPPFAAGRFGTAAH